MAKALTERGRLGASSYEIEGEVLAHLGGHFLGAELQQSLAKMWRTKMYSDIILKAGDEEIKAHKLLIGAHCSYFRDLPDFQKQTTVTVKKMEADVLHLVLTYLYHGELDVPINQVPAMMKAADTLGVQALQRQCRYVMLSDQPVTSKNCLEMWAAAFDNDDQALCARALEVALEYFPRLQHDPAFKQLPPACVADYLSHPSLRVVCQEDRLNACLAWVRTDPDSRVIHLSQFLDVLPLHKMNDWFLQQIMDDALVEDKDTLKAKLQAGGRQDDGDKASSHVGIGAGGSQDDGGKASSHVGIGAGKQLAPVSGPRTVAVKGGKAHTRWLIMAGMRLRRDDKLQDTCEEIQAVKLEGDHTLVTLEKVGPGVKNSGVKLCCDGNRVFIVGLGGKYDEVWMCTLSASELTQCTRLGAMMAGRRFHGLAYHDGTLYVVGGRVQTGPEDQQRVVEIWDVEAGTSRQVPCLQYYLIQDSGGFLCNTVCCYTEGSLLIYGPFVSKDIYRHTLQVYSVSQRAVTHSIIVPRDTEGSVYAVLPVGSRRYLLIARDYTDVCSWQDIINNTPEHIGFCDHYEVPNCYCAVTLSEDQQCVLLYGGDPKSGRPQHYVYSARVRDIVNNTVGGWSMVHSPWPAGDCDIYSSDTLCVST